MKTAGLFGGVQAFCVCGTALLLAGEALAASTPAPPNPLEILLHPPRVRELTARRTYEDHKSNYVLLRFDGTNFYWRMSSTRAHLYDKKMLAGDSAAGRLNNVVWTTMDDHVLGNNIWEFDLSGPAPANGVVSDHRDTTLKLADDDSRLGRCILTFGVDVPMLATVTTNDGKFFYQDGNDEDSGTITLGPLKSAGIYEFTTKWKAETKRGDYAGARHFYECRGLWALSNSLPVQCETYEIISNKPSFIVAEDQVQATLAKGPISERLLAMDENVQDGYGSVWRATNSKTIVVLSQAMESDRRMKYLMGLQLSRKNIGLGVAALMAAVILVGGAILIHSQRQENKSAAR